MTEDDGEWWGTVGDDTISSALVHTKPFRALNPRPRTWPGSPAPLVGASSFMLSGVGASYIVVVQQTSGEALAIGEENSYASRLWSLKEFYGTGDIRGRSWTYVVFDGKIGLGGAEGRYQCFLLILLFCFYLGIFRCVLPLITRGRYSRFNHSRFVKEISFVLIHQYQFSGLGGLCYLLQNVLQSANDLSW